MAARLGCCIVVTLISLLLCVVQVNGYLQPYLVNTTTNLLANMKTFNPSWRSVGWETGNYGEPTPIYVGYDGNSDLYIGWSDASNGHVSKFINDAYSSDVSISSSEIRGLVVHSDGSFAVLLWATPSLSIAKYDSNGNQAWKTTLETDRAEDFGLGDSRLTYGYLASKGGNRYAAYYKVHGTANSCGSPGTDGHEGDSLSYIDDSGTNEQIWCWGAGIGGCSHQMAGLISYNSVFNRTLPLCVTDCFPGSSDTSNGIGGVYADGVKIHDAIGNCGGTYGGELGGVEITPSGWIVTFNVPNANIGKNQNSLNGKNYDLGSTTVTIDASGNVVVGGINWLTDTSENEIWSSIANYGSNQYLVGYVREETINNQVERKYLITLVDGSGKLLGGSEDITTVAGWGERNGFLAMPNGDVVWVYPYTYAAGAAGAYTTPTSQITVFRVKAGGSAAPFPSAASQISPFWFNLFF